MNSCVRFVTIIWAIRPRSKRRWRQWPPRARPSRPDAMRAAAFLLLALWLAQAPAWAAESTLQQQQAEARRNREALRERIAKLEKQIQSAERSEERRVGKECRSRLSP